MQFNSNDASCVIMKRVALLQTSLFMSRINLDSCVVTVPLNLAHRSRDIHAYIQKNVTPVALRLANGIKSASQRMKCV